jgi:hypothetical protein
LERFASGKDQLISWRYVQPLSVEDHTKDVVTLSVAREQALELPSEDLGRCAGGLVRRRTAGHVRGARSGQGRRGAGRSRARAKRQLIAFLREEKARLVLAQLSVPQLADLFSDLPTRR